MRRTKPVSTLVTLLLVSFSSFANNNELQVKGNEILNLRRQINQELLEKSHVFSQEIYSISEGNLEGSLSGSYKSKSRTAGAILGALIGVAGGVVTAGAPMLLGATGLQSHLLVSAGWGGAAGFAVGAPSANGEINGSLKGSYRSSSWENHKDTVLFGITVLPDNYEAILNLKKQQRFLPVAPLVPYFNVLENVAASGRFLTTLQTANLLKKIAQLKLLIEDYEVAFFNSNATEAKYQRLLDDNKAWLSKKITLLKLYNEAFILQPISETLVTVFCRATAAKTSFSSEERNILNQAGYIDEELVDGRDISNLIEYTDKFFQFPVSYSTARNPSVFERDLAAKSSKCPGYNTYYTDNGKLYRDNIIVPDSEIAYERSFPRLVSYSGFNSKSGLEDAANNDDFFDRITASTELLMTQIEDSLIENLKKTGNAKMDFRRAGVSSVAP